MTVPTRSDWDVKIAGVGYMLATQGPVSPDGGIRPAFSEELIQYPAARQASGGQGYQNWPAQIETAWLLKNIAGGYGEKIWDNGSTRHYYGFVDTRFPGHIIMPPELNTAAIVGEDRIHDAFQRTIGGTDTQFVCMGRYVKYWTNPDSPDNDSVDLGTGLIAKSAANFQGANDVLLTYVAVEASGGMPLPYRTFTGAAVSTVWALDDQNPTVAPDAALIDDNGTFTEDTAPPYDLTLNSLVAAEDFVYIRADQPFEGLTMDINATNGNASVLTVNYWNGSAWTDLSASDGTASGGATFAQDGDITWTLPTDWDTNSVNDGAGFHVQFVFSGDLDASVSTTDIDLIQRDTAAFFAVHDAKLYRIAKTSGGFTLAAADDGGNGATWVTIGVVTDVDNAVTGMYSAGSRLYITAQTSLHVLSGDGTSIDQEVWPHPRSLRDTFNGVGASEWNGRLWAPSRFGFYNFTDQDGFILIDRSASPGRLFENNSPVKGKITCFAGDDFFGYAIMRNDEDSKSFLMSYNEDNASWHPLLELGDITARKMWVSDIGHATNPILYWSAGDDIRWIILPRNSPNPSQDSATRFDTGTDNVGQLYTGRFLSNFEYENKSWLTGKVLADDLDTGQTIKYEFRATDDGAWSTLGTFNTDPVGESNFSTSVSARFIELRLTLATNDNTKTPIIRSIYTGHAVRYPFKRAFGVAVRLGSHQAFGGAVVSQGKSKTFKDILKNAVASATPITFIHPDKMESLDVIPLDYRVFTIHDVVEQDLEYIGFMEMVEHQATVFGTHARLAALIHAQMAAFTHAGLQTQ